MGGRVGWWGQFRGGLSHPILSHSQLYDNPPERTPPPMRINPQVARRKFSGLDKKSSADVSAEDDQMKIALAMNASATKNIRKIFPISFLLAPAMGGFVVVKNPDFYIKILYFKPKIRVFIFVKN